MKYTVFHADQFHRDVEKAMHSVQQILETNRMPRLAHEMDHTYDDKYALSEFMTNTAMSALMSALERMGLTKDALATLQQWVQVEKRTITLRMEFCDSCHFFKEQNVNVRDGERTIEVSTQSSTGFFGVTKTKQEETKLSVTTAVKEYHWKVGITYKVYIYAGNDPNSGTIELQSRSSSTIIITTGQKKAPFPESTIHTPIETSLTWIVQQISLDKKVCLFKIDRSNDKCKTPIQNKDTKSALHFFDSMSRWSNQCMQFFKSRIDSEIMGNQTQSAANAPQSRSPDLQSIKSNTIFCPIFPLMETPRNLAGTAEHQEYSKSMVLLSSPTTADILSPLMSVGDMDKFLNEHIRSLDDQLTHLQSTFSPHQLVKLVTVAEAGLVLLWLHIVDLCRHLENAIGYIEDMLTKQLIAAIGKEVQAKDFDQFMAFHNQKLLSSEYAPTPFCYAIRRPGHDPDGILSIECTSNNTDTIDPIESIARSIPGESGPSIFIPIDAATSIEMTGPRYLHGWIQHRFASSDRSQFSLIARARQFSSFVLLVGVMAGPDKFNPKEAIIVQNKDKLLIPLLLNELPTAKEFKDAIVSLSPEQKRFATAFRGMQLESSVFGVCVIQLKPQMEVLLNLPDGALTKEIRLTQDLTSLFVEYQIPSDLLSFDGDKDSSVQVKVDVVKAHVKAVLDVINDAKRSELEEVAKVAAMSFHKNVANMADSDEEASDMMTISPKRKLGAPGPHEYHMGYQLREFVPMASRMATVSSANAWQPEGLVSRRLQSGTVSMSHSTSAVLATSSSSPSSPSRTMSQPLAQILLSDPGGVLDFTMIPKQLDMKLDKYNSDSSIRATIIEASKKWTRMRQENLLTKVIAASLCQADITTEKSKAFDLLDALSRSGSLPIACAELHIVIATTHCFENNVMGTVLQDNINPIEKVEQSTLIIASTIYGINIPELIKDEPERARLSVSFPLLFESE